MSDTFINGKAQPHTPTPTRPEVAPTMPTQDMTEFNRELSVRPYRELFGLNSADIVADPIIEKILERLPGEDVPAKSQELRTLMAKLGGHQSGKEQAERVMRYLTLLGSVKEELLRLSV